MFCTKLAENQDAANFIVHRAELNFVILNLFPYTTGHLMVVPYEHVPTLEATPLPTLHELIDLAREAEMHLKAAYGAKGFNAGLNIGKCAGAGIAGHLHLHVLPRWPGDANFASVIGETRVMPEALPDTYEKLARLWARA